MTCKFAITLLGFFIVPSLGYYFGIKIFRRQQFISDYRIFSEAFIPAFQSLGKENTSLKEIVIAEFSKHEKAKIAFARVLGKADRRRYDRFNKTWKKYEEAYQSVSGYDDKDTLSKLEQFIKETGDYKTQHPLQPLVKEIHDYKKFWKGHILLLLDHLLEIGNKYET